MDAGVSASAAPVPQGTKCGSVGARCLDAFSACKQEPLTSNRELLVRARITYSLDYPCVVARNESGPATNRNPLLALAGQRKGFSIRTDEISVAVRRGPR